MSQQSFIVQINRILIIIVSILLINCKRQDKDVEIGNVKGKEVNLANMTFLGVNKTDSIYTVYNRCDGGYPSLHFKQNEFYFYDPQEGANYIIKDIKNSNNKYVINTTGYYFIKGENIIKQNDTWFLEKRDDLLWTFQNEKWKKSIIFSDSINLNKKKIAYKVQPCRECSEDCVEDEKNTNEDYAKKLDEKVDTSILLEKLDGVWSDDCNSNKTIAFISTLESVQFGIPSRFSMNAQLKKVDTNKYEFYFTDFPPIIPLPDEMQVWGNMDNEKPVGTIEIISESKMNLTWFGFYYKKTKKYIQTENPFSKNSKEATIIHCTDR